jgi:hypothetical protein
MKDTLPAGDVLLLDLAGVVSTGSYNQIVRISAVLLVILSLAACNRGIKNNDAVRQGVINHLSKVGLNVAGMDVSLTSVQINGKEADATVSIAPKGGNAAQGMSMKYHLQQQGSEWVVTGRQDTGASPHGAGAMPAAPSGGMPGGENPHGAGMAAPGGAPGKMPSPEDLPPAKKK